MDRRTLLLGALALAGCAQAPVVPVSTPALTPASTPTPTPSPAGLAVGTDQTPTGTMLAALLTQAASGTRQASLGTDWQSVLADGSIGAGVLFATTRWAELSTDDEPSNDSVGELADLLTPKISVMTPGSLDGGLVWKAAVNPAVSSLEQVGKLLGGKVAAVPGLALERGDGLPGLTVVYGAKLSHVVQDDPVARAALITSGKAAIGAFRKTEYLGTDALGDLADPEKMCLPDLVVLAVNAALADAQPKTVLALSAVVQALTNDELAGLQKQVVAGAAPSDVAGGWLRTKGLI